VTGLVGPNGKPISSADFKNKKAPTPALGERYGQWAGDEVRMLNLPGGGAIAFDLTNLTLADFRQMKGHYQINSSLSILTFMMHQMEWHIECEDKKMEKQLEENLSDVWSRLVRAMSQALWAGYSPNVLQWENDVEGRRIVLNKIKDLVPEDCTVNWKTVEGAADENGIKPKFKIYDGIKQFGSATIPVDNSYWYPLLMENGNYYGRRLLESAFQPWFFSTLMHLFANRYYERFGEPVPVGRAPYEDEINVEGTQVRGNQLMASILQSLRNRSTVVLPNEKTQFGEESTLDFDYQIEYLESQMRGADFERYMTRLDEEMSLAMFTPILMMRTADVGSYNLGTQHTQVYQWMLNAISGDWADYINKYILRPLNFYNSPRGFRAPPAKIKFVRMGKIKGELLQAIVTELFKQNKVKYDTRQIGELAGLTLEEIDQVAGEEPNAAPDQGTPPSTEPGKPKDVGRQIVARLEPQVVKAFRKGTFGNEFTPSLSHHSQMEDAIRDSGYSDAHARASEFFDRMESWLNVTMELGTDEFEDSGRFMRHLSGAVDANLQQVLS
jgi:hypothetical protein